MPDPNQTQITIVEGPRPRPPAAARLEDIAAHLTAPPAGIRFCLIRPIQSGPQGEIPSDVDLLVAQQDVSRLKQRVIDYCRALKLPVLIRQRDNRIGVTITRNGETALILDFATKQQVRDRTAKRFDMFGFDDIAEYVRADMGAVPELSPDIGLLLYLLHVSAKPYKLKRSPERVLARIVDLAARAGPESKAINEQAKALIAPVFQPDALNQLALPLLRERVNLRPYHKPSPKPKRNLVASVVGPDGSGKTAISNHILGRFSDSFDRKKVKTLYRKSPIYLAFRAVFQGLWQDSNTMDEAISLPCFLLALRGFHRRRSNAKKGFIFDRYFYDLLLKGIRSHNRPRRAFWWHWAARRVPPSDLVIVLDVPWEVAHSRKPELQASAWPVIYQNYFDVSDINGTPLLAVCYTDASFENTTTFVMQTVSKALELHELGQL